MRRATKLHTRQELAVACVTQRHAQRGQLLRSAPGVSRLGARAAAHRLCAVPVRYCITVPQRCTIDTAYGRERKDENTVLGT